MPSAIPSDLVEEFFEREGGTHVFACLRNEFSGLPKKVKLSAESPAQALDLLFGGNLAGEVAVQELSRLFFNTADRYAFEIPEKPSVDSEGKNLTKGRRDTFQGMELAINMAAARGCNPEDCFQEATEALNRAYTTK